MGKLPATSYVRMVDIWLIFGQLYPFIQEKSTHNIYIFNHHSYQICYFNLLGCPSHSY